MKLRNLTILIPALFAMAGGAGAETTRGNDLLITQAEIETVLPDGGLALQVIQAGPTNAPEGDIMHGGVFHCSAMIVTPAGGETDNRGICFTLHANGDISWLWFAGDMDTGEWGFMGGTGEYEDIAGTGSFLAPPPGPLTPGSFEGTWEIADQP